MTLWRFDLSTKVSGHSRSYRSRCATALGRLSTRIANASSALGGRCTGSDPRSNSRRSVSRMKLPKRTRTAAGPLHGHRFAPPPRGAQRVGLVRGLPGELRLGAAEMAEGRGLLEDRAAQARRLDEA